MDVATLVGSAATLCSMTSFVPQAWRIVRTRDTAALSRRMYAVTVAGFTLWLAFGCMLGQWPLIVSNGVCLALSAFILAMILMPQHRKEAVAAALTPAGVSEPREAPRRTEGSPPAG